MYVSSFVYYLCMVAYAWSGINAHVLFIIHIIIRNAYTYLCNEVCSCTSGGRLMRASNDTVTVERQSEREIERYMACVRACMYVWGVGAMVIGI